MVLKRTRGASQILLCDCGADSPVDLLNSVSSTRKRVTGRDFSSLKSRYQTSGINFRRCVLVN